ncbi:MAG: polysaccharide deacetylase family protein [Frankia sp.]
MSRNLPVLMYHSIGVSASREFRRWQVGPALFADQLAALSEAGYGLASLSDTLDNRVGRTITLTFDDAFHDFSDAIPILRAAGATATLYVPTAHVGRRASWLAGYAEAELAVMSWAELREVAAAGVEIGSHGHEHSELDVLPADEMRRDISTSRATLRDHLGVAVRSFCYPFGYHTSAVRSAVAAAGFESACEVGYRRHRSGDDPFAVGRLIVTADTRPEQMVGLVTRGQSDVATELRRRTRTPWRAYRAARYRAARYRAVHPASSQDAA